MNRNNSETKPQMKHNIRYAIAAMICWAMLAVYTPPVLAATLLPPGEITFFDDNGDPLAGGTVQFYIPATTTPKDTWKDAAQAVLNTNPVVLDSGGRAVIFGSGAYRQIVKDSLGNTVWDKLTYDTAPGSVTAWGGTSTGGANNQSIVAPDFGENVGQSILFIAGATNTGATTLNVNSNGPIAILKETPSGPVPLTGGEIAAGNVIQVVWDSTQFILLNSNQVIIGPLTNLASAATTQLGTVPSHNVNITGTTDITSFGSTEANLDYPIYNLTFAGALTLTYDATALILPGAKDIDTAAGDTAVVSYIGAGHWKVLSYTPLASGPYNSANLPPLMPGGRLTLTTNVPVLVSNVSGATTVFYTPYIHSYCPEYDGTSWSSTACGQMSQTLADATKSPAAGAVSKVYDMFMWDDAGTFRTTRGPAWTSGVTRGTGAGTTQLERVNGVLMNQFNITNGPKADRGIYVGTISTSATGANGQLNMEFLLAGAAGGTNSRLDVWNMYNRVPMTAVSRDTTNTWNYTTATWRSADNSASNRINYVVGLDEDALQTSYSVEALNNTAAAYWRAGVAMDATNAIIDGSSPGALGNTNASAVGGTTIATFTGDNGGIGIHFIQAIEYSTATGTTVWQGDNGDPTVTQMSLTVQMRR